MMIWRQLPQNFFVSVFAKALQSGLLPAMAQAASLAKRYNARPNTSAVETANDKLS